MAKSPHTFELWATAHKSGDEYYRQLTASLSSGLTIDGECKRLALSYLNALEDLERHLQTLDDSDEVRDMKASNAKFIETIREDLKRFELTPA
jgi:hypothetical protein